MTFDMTFMNVNTEQACADSSARLQAEAEIGAALMTSMSVLRSDIIVEMCFESPARRLSSIPVNSVTARVTIEESAGTDIRIVREQKVTNTESGMIYKIEDKVHLPKADNSTNVVLGGVSTDQVSSKAGVKGTTPTEAQDISYRAEHTTTTTRTTTRVASDDVANHAGRVGLGASSLFWFGLFFK
jgi:hypothetical protein